MHLKPIRRLKARAPWRIAAAVLAAALTTSLPQAGAQAPSDVQDNAATVSVSPPRDEFDAAPGQQLTRTIRLTNAFTSPRSFAATVQNFEPQGEEGQAGLTDDESPYSLKPWVTVTPTRTTIAPSSFADFTVTIAVPAGAGPGTRYGAIVFTPAVTQEQGSNLSIVSEVSSLLIVRVPGDVDESATIASFAAHDHGSEGPIGEPKRFFDDGPVDYVVRLENQGNVHLRPEVKVVVENMFGREIATLDEEPATVLPASIRRFVLPWDQDTLFGRYTATATVTYGETRETATATVSFWAAPVMKIVVGLIILLALFVLLWLPRRRLKKAWKALTAGDTPTEKPARRAEPEPEPEKPAGE